ncbi:MAG: hypothetical protein LC744_08115 [Chloroflexi bacterium]|nr:hypothetical protein [Chloroflexota bacterium]
MLNLTAEPQMLPSAGNGRVLIGTHRDRDGSPTHGDLELRPNEAVVIEESAAG